MNSFVLDVRLLSYLSIDVLQACDNFQKCHQQLYQQLCQILWWLKTVLQCSNYLDPHFPYCFIQYIRRALLGRDLIIKQIAFRSLPTSYYILVTSRQGPFQLCCLASTPHIFGQVVIWILMSFCTRHKCDRVWTQKRQNTFFFFLGNITDIRFLVA